MYARVTRFEGVDMSKVDEMMAGMRQMMEAGKRGELPDDAPEGVQTLQQTVTRFVNLLDRERGASLGIAFCETEDDLRKANEALEGMSPPSDGGGRRTTVELYEVGIDESFR